MGFKREPKMKTTEPSNDEVGKGMKKGGMAMGGALASAAQPMGRRPMPSARPDPRAAMLQAAMAQRGASAGAPVMRKKGGEVESKAMHAKEQREIKSIKTELKSHEGKPAAKAHKGLKTGGLEGRGYKSGGKVSEYASTKVVGAKMRKSISSTTSGVESKMAYARGGSVKAYENTEMHGGEKMPTKKLGTKGITQSPAGYKEGGHVSMGCKGADGYKENKKGGSW